MTPVNNIVLNADITSNAINNLLYQFENSPNLQNMVSVLTSELQEIESEVIKLMTLRTLENATGQQLDNIGEVLNVRRTSADDEIYRAILKIRNARQSVTGTAESSIYLVKLFTGDEFASVYQNNTYLVDVYYNDTCNPSATLDNIKAFFPVVTSLRGVVSSDGLMFGFDGDDTSGGFGSVHDASAGAGFGSLLT